MPHKGFFTQGAMVLTERPLADEAVERALSSFEVVSREMLVASFVKVTVTEGTTPC